MANCKNCGSKPRLSRAIPSLNNGIVMSFTLNKATISKLLDVLGTEGVKARVKLTYENFKWRISLSYKLPESDEVESINLGEI